MISAYLGLGSNLNDPPQQLRQAFQGLSGLPNTEVKTISSIYQTAPIGLLNQADFCNAVCQLSTQLSAEILLDKILAIEQAHLRSRGTEKNGPRTLDLDILLYGDKFISQKNLEIPHPRLAQRAFVIIPLLEIAPDLVLPDGRAVSDIANSEVIKSQHISLSSPSS